MLDRRLILGTVGRIGETEIERVAPLLGWDDRRTADEVAQETGRRTRLAETLQRGAARHSLTERKT